MCACGTEDEVGFGCIYMGVSGISHTSRASERCNHAVKGLIGGAGRGPLDRWIAASQTTSLRHQRPRPHGNGHNIACASGYSMHSGGTDVRSSEQEKEEKDTRKGD